MHRKHGSEKAFILQNVTLTKKDGHMTINRHVNEHVGNCEYANVLINYWNIYANFRLQAYVPENFNQGCVILMGPETILFCILNRVGMVV